MPSRLGGPEQPGYARQVVAQISAEERAQSELGKVAGDRYRLTGLLGYGETSAVYRALTHEDEAFALKLWYPEHATPESSAHTLNGARQLLGLSHPHVVTTLTCSKDPLLGQFVVARFVEARDLAALLAKEPALPAEIAVRLILQAASGVALAHARGLAHGSLKPAHLLLSIDPTSDEVSVQVCEFGIGSANGSAAYASPEQSREPSSLTAQSDVWSLCAMLWEALSGQRLWGKKSNPAELRAAICEQPIPELQRIAPWVTRELACVVQRGLERAPELRPPSAQALIADLSVFSGGTDRVKKTDLIALTAAQRGALQVQVKISPTAAAGMANLARGGRGGTSLPPQRAARSGRPGPGTNSWTMALLLIVIVGGGSMLLGYLMHQHPH